MKKKQTVPTMVSLTFRVHPALAARLREVAKKEGRRQSDVARVILADVLATWEARHEQ